MIKNKDLASRLRIMAEDYQVLAAIVDSHPELPLPAHMDMWLATQPIRASRAGVEQTFIDLEENK